MPRFFIDIEARFAQFQDSLARIEKDTTRAANNMEAAFSRVKGVLASLGVGISAGAWATEIIRQSKEAEQASNRLNAVLKATGGIAGLTRRELDDMADSLSKVSQFDDDGIRNAQAQLIKFGNINREVFGPALKLSADLAAFMGTEIPEAAQLLGKALQAPKEGLGGLERQLGQLDPAITRLIEKNLEQNRLLEAQKLLLGQVESKIGDVANKMNTGYTKALGDLEKKWGDLNKAIGKEGKTPVVQALEAVTKELDFIKRTIEEGDWFDKLLLFMGAGRSSPVGRAILGQPTFPVPEGTRQSVTGKIPPFIPGLSDIQEFERASAAADAPPGFKTPEEYQRYLKEKKEEELRILREWMQEKERISRQIVEVQDEFAQTLTEASEALKNIDIKNAEERQRIEDRAAEGAQQFSDASIQSFVESAETMQELAESMVYTFDAAGNRVVMLRTKFDELQNAQKKNSDVARELGFTFQSAFENAIIEGEKLREVLRGILQDIARIILRKQVTEPLAAGVAGLDFGKIFGGGGGSVGTDNFSLAMQGMASGGQVSAGRAVVVGEQGPELFVPNAGGNIVPNHALGGVVQNLHLHFNPATPLATREVVYSMLPQIAEASRRGVQDAKARGRG